jgi:hypothetical protein
MRLLNTALFCTLSDFTPFLVCLGLVLAYPVVGLIAWFLGRALKKRIAAEHCPKCGVVFGPPVVSTIREIMYFGRPVGTIMRVVCPHCSACWHYCNGKYTLRPSDWK